MTISIPRGVTPFFMAFAVLSALGTGILAGTFCLCSHESIQRMLRQDGLLHIFGARWLGFFIFGIVLATGIAALHLLVSLLARRHNWAAFRQDFLVALVLQLIATFAGSLLFTHSIA